MIRTVFIGVAALVVSIGPAAAASAKAEIDFVTRAAMANMMAIAESRLAPDQAVDQQIKDYANGLITAHDTAKTALQAAADGSGAAVPATLDADHQARLAALRQKTGAAFDQAYVADQAEVHSNALTLYADYMLLGDNAKLKALAITMIPITEAQFKKAQALSPP